VGTGGRGRGNRAQNFVHSLLAQGLAGCLAPCCRVRASGCRGAMPPRARCTADLGKLAQIIAPHARTPDFLQYTEKLRGSLNKARILAMAAMFRQLVLETQGNLNFSQSVAEKLFDEVRKVAEASWQRPLSQAEYKEWKPSLARQFRAMCGHLLAAKAKSYAWASSIVNSKASGSSTAQQVVETNGEEEEEEEPEHEEHGEEEECEPDEAEEEPEADALSENEPLVAKPVQKRVTFKLQQDPPPARKKLTGKQQAGPEGKAVPDQKDDFEYSFDAELINAVRYRRTSAVRSSKAEQAVELVTGPDEVVDHPTYRFADGKCVLISCVTMKFLRLLQAAAAARGLPKGKLWSQGPYYIAYKKDRSPMLRLHGPHGDDGADKPVLQIHIRHFGKPDDEVIWDHTCIMLHVLHDVSRR